MYKACCSDACWAPSLEEGSMAGPASNFVSPTGWFTAPEPTPRMGPMSNTAPPRDNWMLWAMLPPPPPPSLQPAARSEHSLEAQPRMKVQSLSGAPPPFDTQILPGTQPPFDSQSPHDSHPRLSGQPDWKFQASTSWCWGQSPGALPQQQNSYNPPGRLWFLAVPPLIPLSPLLYPISLYHSALYSWSLVIDVSNYVLMEWFPCLFIHELLIIEFQLYIRNCEHSSEENKSPVFMELNISLV